MRHLGHVAPVLGAHHGARPLGAQYGARPHDPPRRRRRTGRRSSLADRRSAHAAPSRIARGAQERACGGQRQRLALARAYAVRPDFLFMDEPFGALDAQTRSAMQDLLLGVLQSEGKTVMLITHSVEEAIYLSNRVIVISARPSRIKRVIDVPFPFPRQQSLHDQPEFARLRSEVHALVMEEYEAQQRQNAGSPPPG